MGVRVSGSAWGWMVIGAAAAVGMFAGEPSVWAADEDTAEAAEALHAPVTDTEQHIRQAIEVTRQTDPELAQEMERQLELLERGEVELPAAEIHERASSLGAPGDLINQGLPGGSLGEPQWTPGEEDDLPPEVRTQLDRLFQEKGTGDPAQDGHVREEAEQILREHGIEPPWERDGDWELGEDQEQWKESQGHEDMEHAWEEMSPEVREQMERMFEHEDRPELDRELFERELELPGHEADGPEREGDQPALEHEDEAPVHEYEAPTQEYEVPEHESEAPQHEYEQPEFEQPQPEGGFSQ